MSEKTFKEMYVDQMRDVFDAESRLIEALPKVADAVSTPELATALTNHLRETKGQVTRLKGIFASLEEDPEGMECKAMKGLVKEGDEAIDEYDKGSLRDAALILACQKIEHYEIAAYGTLRVFAQILGRDDDFDLLSMTLAEESKADETLNDIAMGFVNDEALREPVGGR